jgi:hypothetical protein
MSYSTRQAGAGTHGAQVGNIDSPTDLLPTMAILRCFAGVGILVVVLSK